MKALTIRSVSVALVSNCFLHQPLLNDALSSVARLRNLREKPSLQSSSLIKLSKENKNSENRKNISTIPTKFNMNSLNVHESEKKLEMKKNEIKYPRWCPEKQIYEGGIIPGEISDSELESLLMESGGDLNIFGYGSLCWNPGSESSGDSLAQKSKGVTRQFGRAVGWKRCWCQRSTDHRGTPTFQGLVCTLLSDDEFQQLSNNSSHNQLGKLKSPTMTEGVIYTVPASLVDQCLKELDFREKGGYSRDIIQVELMDHHESKSPKLKRALLYRGTPENPAFWKRPLMDLPFAAAIMSVATGPSGPNDEYLYNLDSFLALTKTSNNSITSLSSVSNDPNEKAGDSNTRALAHMCKDLQTKSTIFFIYGSGSNQYEQLLLSNQNHEYLLSEDKCVQQLTESILVVPKLQPRITENEEKQNPNWIQPSQLYAGGGHSALLLTNGNLYLWGNNENGQLGRISNSTTNFRDKTDNTYFAQIEHLANIDVEKVDLGHTHTLVLERKSGKIFGFGDNARGQVDRNIARQSNEASKQNNVVIPITPEFICNETCIDIAAGLFHSAAITSRGELITWGCNRFNQCLSSSNVDNEVVRWKPEDGSKLVKVVCGRRHTVVLDEHGRIWTMGDNRYGQLGRDTTLTKAEKQSSKEIKENNPKLINGILSRKGSGCIDISCGWSHCIAIVKNADVIQLYGWGRNDKGQLGIPTKTHVMNPEYISVRDYDSGGHEIEIQHCNCGAESSTILCKNDISLWTSGWNEHGNLSSGHTDDIFEFKKVIGARITKPLGTNSNSSNKIIYATGGGHMIALMV